MKQYSEDNITLDISSESYCIKDGNDVLLLRGKDRSNKVAVKSENGSSLTFLNEIRNKHNKQLASV